MQLETIAPSEQADMIASFWQMMRELESQADCDNDNVLKHMVVGYYKQWNRVTGDNKSPIWVTREGK